MQMLSPRLRPALASFAMFTLGEQLEGSYTHFPTPPKCKRTWSEQGTLSKENGKERVL